MERTKRVRDIWTSGHSTKTKKVENINFLPFGQGLSIFLLRFIKLQPKLAP